MFISSSSVNNIRLLKASLNSILKGVHVMILSQNCAKFTSSIDFLFQCIPRLYNKRCYIPIRSIFGNNECYADISNSTSAVDMPMHALPRLR